MWPAAAGAESSFVAGRVRAGFLRTVRIRPTDMLGMFKDLSEATRQSAARSMLNGLMTWLGEAGLAAARTNGGLLAEIDQHAAGVRDAFGDPENGPSLVSLAGYATGVRDALIEADWQIPSGSEVDWSALQWPSLRLLGICSLARRHGYA